MLFAPRNAQQRIDGNLKRRHSCAHDKQRPHRNVVGRQESETQRSDGAGEEGGNHHRLFGKTFYPESGRNRHHAIRNKEGERQESRGRRLTPKLVMMSGTIGPRMLVNSDITKNVRKTKPTM